VAGYMLADRADEDTVMTGRPGRQRAALLSSSTNVTHVVPWRAQDVEDGEEDGVAIDTRAQRTAPGAA